GAADAEEPGRARDAPARVPIVGHAVAVVVGAVAALARRRHLACAGGRPGAAGAGLGSAVADADAVGDGLPVVAVAEQSLVDLPVAVVVDAVADLGRIRSDAAGAVVA